jgi:RNA recognition motif-containing protein
MTAKRNDVVKTNNNQKTAEPTAQVGESPLRKKPSTGPSAKKLQTDVKTSSNVAVQKSKTIVDAKSKSKTNKVQKPRALKQVVFCNLPKKLKDPAQLVEFVKTQVSNCGEVKCFPSKTSTDAITVGFGKAVNAARCVKELNNLKVDGVNISVQIAALYAVQHSDNCKRLIVRNLPFTFTKENVTELFQTYGNVTKVTLPMKPKFEGGQPVPCGFCFVTLSDKASAEAAIAGLNGTKVRGRVIVVDWSVDKEVFTSVKTLEEKLAQKENLEPMKLTTITLDKADEREEEDGDDDDDVSQFNDEHVEEITLPMFQDTKPKLPAREAGFDLEGNESLTLFIRNVPCEASEQEIVDAFSKYGKVLWAKIVKDKITKTPKGTAFVRFVEQASAKKCLDEDAKAESVLLRDIKTKNPALNSLEGVGVNVLGKRVNVFTALKR